MKPSLRSRAVGELDAEPELLAASRVCRRRAVSRQKLDDEASSGADSLAHQVVKRGCRRASSLDEGAVDLEQPRVNVDAHSRAEDHRVVARTVANDRLDALAVDRVKRRGTSCRKRHATKEEHRLLG